MTSHPNSVGAALIGCGRIAGHHARSIRAVDGIELVAVCDLSVDKAQAYGEEFSVPWYTDYRAMLRDHPEIRLVSVITPSGMHHEHALEMMGRWGKSVVVEKPTFLKASQLDAAYDLAERSGVHMFPVFQNRHNRAVQRVKHAVDRGELGDIRVISVRTRWCRPQRYYDQAPWRGTFAQDGGALTNQGIHHLDLLRYLGGEVGQVAATMRTLGAQIEVEDTVVGNFSFVSGAVGSLEITTAARPIDYEASISIVGAKGLAQLGGIAVNELQVFTPDPAACAAASEDFSGCVYGYGHEAIYRDIAAVFHRGASYPVSRQDNFNTIRLLNAFYAADERGEVVTVGEVAESSRLGRPDEALADLYRLSEAMS